MKKELFMLRAIELASFGVAEGHGGPFGAVVVKDNQIVGEGWNRVLGKSDPTAHGEIVAIRDACKRLGTHSLEGCEIYTTGEPCPMCLGAIYWARLDHIYFGFSIGDAQRIGFDDVDFHEELKKSPENRKIQATQLCRESAIKLLRSYQENPDKQLY